ncbi:MAG: hypothetical protein ACRD5H_14880 [Nitrososphaerales archaeon]
MPKWLVVKIRAKLTDQEEQTNEQSSTQNGFEIRKEVPGRD